MEPMKTLIRRAAPWVALAPALAFAACTGTVSGTGTGSVSGTGAGSGTGSGAVTGTGSAPGGNTGGSGGGGPTGTGSVVGTGGAAAGTTAGISGAGTGGGNPAGGAPGIVIPIVPAPSNPGLVVARRLNRTEYNNTVADLLGTKLTPAIDFPADDLGAEFDTVGSALSLSPTYVIAYEKAAYALLNDLFTDATRKQTIVTCNIDTGGDACAQTVLGAFARKAWRRPVTTTELQGLLKPVTTARTLGATPTEGLKSAMAAVLLSPFFVFKLEIDPDPASTMPRRLTGHELATRLAYALWSSMPDSVLSTAADLGQLSTDAQVSAQIDRMLAAPRAGALLDTFAAEWFDVKELEDHDIEPTVFPKYTPALALSMKQEARRFVDEFLHTTRPVNEMLNARFTFLDTSLATHYGLTRTAPAGTAAADFVRVDTSSAPRAGLLTLGALLTTTSFPSRTSPVKRGEFVFRRLLCAIVPAPPPDVPSLPEATTATAGLTLRQRTEQHRKDPACSPCHNLMDPIGFGLENYDALGAYRTKDGTAAIDASGTLPDGRTFNGAVELGNVLSGDARFPRCATNKFMIFAIGRLFNQAGDAAWVDHLAGQAWAANGSLPSIIRAVVMSDSFRSRQPRAM